MDDGTQAGEVLWVMRAGGGGGFRGEGVGRVEGSTDYLGSGVGAGVGSGAGRVGPGEKEGEENAAGGGEARGEEEGTRHGRRGGDCEIVVGPDWRPGPRKSLRLYAAFEVEV